jgi:hypothetical protein
MRDVYCLFTSWSCSHNVWLPAGCVNGHNNLALQQSNAGLCSAVKCKGSWVCSCMVASCAVLHQRTLYQVLQQLYDAHPST